MLETTADIQSLQRLIATSNAAAGEFLRSSFEIPEKTLNAGQLITHLQGTITMVLSTVTSKGHPRTAPIIALFYRGHFYIPTVTSSLRSRHVAKNPAVSLSLYEGIDFAVIVHGEAKPVRPDEAPFDELVRLQVEYDGGDVRTWGDPVFLRVDPTHLYSFARYPDRFPDSD